MRLTAAAVLFDMDGTLVDSTAMVESVWTEFALENAVDPAAVIDFGHGRPSRDTIAKFVADSTRIDEWLDWIHTAEGERFTEVTTIPGALDVVKALPTGTWAVVTSAIRAAAAERLSQNGFPTVPVLIGADDVRRGKPHPEPYLTAASALGVAAQDCVVFEDAIAGVEAGLAAGAKVVAVGDVEANGIAGRISDFSEVTVEATGEGLTITFP